MTFIRILKDRYETWPVFIVTLIQTFFLISHFTHFEWAGLDDLLTLTIIDQENLKEMIVALGSGLNLFPPLYFLLSYFFITELGFNKDLLLWTHIPLFWVSMYFTFLLIKKLSNYWTASFATVCMCTLKSAYLTQAIYVRPYCLYYCATVVLAFYSLVFQRENSLKNYILLWISFQFLALSHYYGILLGCFLCTPLLFSKLTARNKISSIITILLPAALTYLYFLPKQLSFNFFHGTTPEASFPQIVEVYEALSYPSLAIIIVFAFAKYFNEEKINTKVSKYNYWGILLWALSPLIIGILLYLFVGEGMYYRYFISCQIGLVTYACYVGTRFIPINHHKFNRVALSVISYALIITWTSRNFGGKYVDKPFYPTCLEFDKAKLLQTNAPFITSHLPTYLKVIHNKKWSNPPSLLRTKKEDVVELPKFHKSLTPTTPKQLAKLDSFFYHFYYSGAYSEIDFNPQNWAKKHGYQASEISGYPLVIHFNRKKSI